MWASMIEMGVCTWGREEDLLEQEVMKENWVCQGSMTDSDCTCCSNSLHFYHSALRSNADSPFPLVFLWNRANVCFLLLTRAISLALKVLWGKSLNKWSQEKNLDRRDSHNPLELWRSWPHHFNKNRARAILNRNVSLNVVINSTRGMHEAHWPLPLNQVK